MSSLFIDKQRTMNNELKNLCFQKVFRDSATAKRLHHSSAKTRLNNSIPAFYRKSGQSATITYKMLL